MKIVILGAAAGGGSPQWNCRCQVCDLAWSGDPRVRRRTQASICVSADGKAWCLLNCSPDIREQISANSCLWPRSGVRGSPVSDVVLTNGDIDHIGGLLALREGHAFTIHATGDIHRILDGNPVFGVLDRSTVGRAVLDPGKRVTLTGGLAIELFPVPGKVPLYLEDDAVTIDRSGKTVGVEVSHGEKRFFYVPGCAEMDLDTRKRFEKADLVFFDGTLWADGEMIATGTGMKTGRRMGHMPVGGSDGSLAALKSAGVERLIYVHINNTNPMLIDGSPEYRAVLAAGAEIGYDGQVVEL